MRPAFHCPNGGIGRRVGLKIQCPLKTCRFEPGFGHRDRSAGNFPPPTCLFLDSVSILHFSLPSPSLHPCAFSISRFYSAPPYMFSSPLPPSTCLLYYPGPHYLFPSFSSLFPYFPPLSEITCPSIYSFPPHLGTNFALSVPAKSFPPSSRHKLRPFCS